MWECFALCRWAGERTPGCLPYDLLWTLRKRRKLSLIHICPWLTREAMNWFWDAYAPDARRRGEITASPLRATPEQLAGLPPAMIITAENDVLRDEGAACLLYTSSP